MIELWQADSEGNYKKPGDTSTANLTVTVSGVNDVPTVVNDTGSMTEDQIGTFTVLSNDTFDPDHGAPTAATLNAVTTTGTITNLAAPFGESIDTGDISVSVNASNQLVVNLGADFQHMKDGESATFDVDYTLHGDQAGDTSPAHMHVTLNGVNDAPTGTDNSFTINEDATLTFSGGTAISGVPTVLNDCGNNYAVMRIMEHEQSSVDT